MSLDIGPSGIILFVVGGGGKQIWPWLLKFLSKYFYFLLFVLLVVSTRRVAKVQLPVSDGQLSSCHGHGLEAAGADLVHCGAGGGLGQAST